MVAFKASTSPCSWQQNLGFQFRVDELCSSLRKKKKALWGTGSAEAEDFRRTAKHQACRALDGSKYNSPQGSYRLRGSPNSLMQSEVFSKNSMPDCAKPGHKLPQREVPSQSGTQRPSRVDCFQHACQHDMTYIAFLDFAAGSWHANTLRY